MRMRAVTRVDSALRTPHSAFGIQLGYLIVTPGAREAVEGQVAVEAHDEGRLCFVSDAAEVRSQKDAQL
jgi:hypothetical protein